MKSKVKLSTISLLLIILTVCIFAACNKQPQKYTVTVVNGTGGGVYVDGSQCSVTANAADSEEFVEWQIDGAKVSADNPYTFTVTRDVTLTAITKQKDTPPIAPTKYTVTVIGGTGSGEYEAGSKCIAEATLDENEAFVSWTDSDRNTVSFDNPYEFEVTQDTTLILTVRHYVDIGEYAMKWVSKSGTLDLEKLIYNDSECVIDSITGKNADAEISCSVNGQKYKLSLNGQGALEMFDGEENLIDVFIPSADKFAGLWSVEGDDVYTLIINELDYNNKFGWTLLDGNGELFDEDLLYGAATKLTYVDGKAQVQFTVSVTDVTFVLDDNGNISTTDGLTYAPTGELFKQTYFADGKLLILDFDNSNVTLDGEQTTFTLSTGEFGSGLYFTLDGRQCALIQLLDCAALLSDGETAYFAAFNTADLNGVWQGNTTLSIINGQITLGQNTAQAQPVFDGGEIFVGFTADGVNYTVYPVADSNVIIRLFDGTDSEYYFKSTADVSGKFTGEYTDNTQTLTIDSKYKITLDGTVYNAKLTVLEDLDRVELQGIQAAALAFGNESKYLIYAGEGKLALLEKVNGKYVIKSAFLSRTAIDGLQDKFNSGLDSAADFYTAGGTNGIKVDLDFENNSVNVCGVPYDFTWGYVIKTTGEEYATVNFTATVYGNVCDCVLYPYSYAPYARMETAFNGKTTRYTLVSNEQFTKLLGTYYVNVTDRYTESISVERDGTLVITDGNSQTGATVTTEYQSYEVTRGNDGVLAVMFKENKGITFEVTIYFDIIGYCAVINTETFVAAEVPNHVGVYLDKQGTAVVELLYDGKIKYDTDGIEGTKETSIESFKISDGRLTVEFSTGFGPFAETISIVFENGSATVTADGISVVYEKKQSGTKPPVDDNKLTPNSFVGDYNLTDDDEYEYLLIITLDANAQTNSTALNVALYEDSEPYDVSEVKLSIVDGKQQLTFSINDGWSFTMTLNDDGSFNIVDNLNVSYTIVE